MRALLVTLAVVGLAFILVATFVIGSRTREVLEETDQVIAVYDPAAEDVATLSLAISDMQRGLTLYVLGGHEVDLRPYVDGERQSALAFASLGRLVGDDPTVAPLLRASERSRNRWLTRIARPAIKAARAGDRGVAEALVLGDESTALYDDLVLDTDRLGNTINATRATVFDHLAELAAQLRQIVIAAMVLLLLALLGAGALLFRWVLAPLDELRRQIREVARRGQHQRLIEPTGPTELAAVGRDAESMRRQLVAEIDEARSARKALEHRAPLVAAIRRELSMPTDPDVAGVSVYGEVRAAEGVLAGDWWDCVAMPGGEAALILTDIAGHGPEAGVAAMRIKHLMAMLLAGGASPEEAVTLAARTFADEADRFATVVVVCVDPQSGAIRWANGGHHPPVIVKADGTIEELGRTGPLLSWLGGPWGDARTRMGAQDVLIAFSDGLIESHDSHGRQLELDGLIRMFRAAADDGAADEEVVQRTLALARQRSVDWDRDDVTLVSLRLADHAGRSATIPGPRPNPAAGSPR